MNPTFFAKQSDFRKWLEMNHKNKTELLVGFYKVDSGKPSITWPQSVDQAICFGWIDGVRRSIDAESYCIRFTPRKSTSIWSAVNIKKVEELTKQKLMQPAGIASYALRKEHKSKIYSYEKEAQELPADFEKKFKGNKKAWTFFTTQPPGYKKQMIHWIIDAKQETTRLSRLEKTITASAVHKRLR